MWPTLFLRLTREFASAKSNATEEYGEDLGYRLARGLKGKKGDRCWKTNSDRKRVPHTKARASEKSIACIGAFQMNTYDITAIAHWPWQEEKCWLRARTSRRRSIMVEDGYRKPADPLVWKWVEASSSATVKEICGSILDSRRIYTAWDQLFIALHLPANNLSLSLTGVNVFAIDS